MKSDPEKQELIGLEIPESLTKRPAWARLENQLEWYDNKSCHCQRWYKRFKVAQIILAVSVPILTHLPSSWATWLTSIAGGLIAVIEAIQHLNQYSTLWVTYRSTAERLKHEKFLFLSEAGPYMDLNDSDRLILLAERVEEHVSTEHANWFNETQKVIHKDRKES
ncbi:MAG: DUF4231 domain-containing protein [Sedimentisphaeraceae bacterium JB056]